MKRVIQFMIGVCIGVFLVAGAACLIRYKNGTRQSTEVLQGHIQDERSEEQDKPDTPKEVSKDSIAEAEKNIQEEKQQIVLAFAGDVCLKEDILGIYDKNGIHALIDEELLAEMTNADICMVNQEFPFSDRGTAMENKKYTFRVSPGYVKIFKELGIDGVTLANNHTLDYGTESLTDTLDTLKNAEIFRIGAGRNLTEAKQPFVCSIGECTIGFLAASRVIPVTGWNAKEDKAGLFTTYDSTQLKQAIKEAKQVCDIVIVYVHWGLERKEYPEQYQRELAYAYIDAGADAVIGSHPHVLQGMEYYKGKPVIYSLGNYMFHAAIQRTALYKIYIEEDAKLSVQMLPCSADNYRLSKSKDMASFTKYMNSISFGVTFDENGYAVPE